MASAKDQVLVAFWCPYPRGGAPSQRFRYEQYLPLLAERRISYQVYPFLDESTNRILYQPGRIPQKVLGIVRGFLRRWVHLFKARSADYVFIHREATPLGPSWAEWLLAKVLQKKIIYDFDDAIWLQDASSVNPVSTLLKWPRKVSAVCRWSHTVSAGNAYLADFARQHTARVIVNPTTIDTDQHHHTLQQQQTDRPVVGWTGSHSTLKYLEPLVPVFQQLERTYDFRLVVIVNRPPDIKLSSLDFVPWNLATEINDLLQLHIGLMPLPNDRWAQGKCGFKALQYLALGIPALVSPVGVNTEIVEHGKEGFHCTTNKDWYHYLSKLLSDASLRTQMGQAGRQKVVDHYSVRANTENFLNLFGDQKS
jgi:glycosyltransferase involved in cell wall biosynthesis